MNSRKTAILVIHGIGEQNPFEALDSFTRGLVAELKSLNPTQPLSLDNHLLRADTRQDNFVRVQAGGAKPIDVYEFYWADKAERKAGLADIVGWLIRASDGAKKFYDANMELVRVYEARGSEAFMNGKMVENWFLGRIGLLFRFLAWLDKVFPPAKWLLVSGWSRSIVLSIISLVHREVVNMLVSYLGDLVVYTQDNERKTTFKARAEILDAASNKIRLLLDSPENYDQVLLAGHSLGSVIAYDAINIAVQRINLDSNLADKYRKIRGLVTFGSPLDKIAFFFRYQSTVNDYVRRQLIAQKHCFRTKDLDLSHCGADASATILLRNPYGAKLDDEIQWVNYWDPLDPVSGQLDFYEVTENVEYAMGGKWGLAHLRYWNFAPMYQDIIRRFLS